MSGALDVLRIKEKADDKFFAPGTQLGDINPNFQMAAVHVELEKGWQIWRGPRRSCCLSSGYCCHWEPCWNQRHHLQEEHWPVSCAEACCCHWSHSNRWLLHTRDLSYPDSNCLLGATASSGHWSQSWPATPHRGVWCQPAHHCSV